MIYQELDGLDEFYLKILNVTSILFYEHCFALMKPIDYQLVIYARIISFLFDSNSPSQMLPA